MGDLIGVARIGGQDQRQLAVAGRRNRQAAPRRHPIRNSRNAARIGTMGKAGKLQFRVTPPRRFERSDARKDAPVHLGQHHMHRQIGGRQAAI